MSEKNRTDAEQAHDFSIIYRVGSLMTSTAMHPDRAKLDARIRSMYQNSKLTLPSSDLLHPGYYGDEQCIAHAGVGYKSTFQLAGDQELPGIRSWSAIDKHRQSPVELIGLVLPNYADPSGFYAVRIVDQDDAEQVPRYFMLENEIDVMHEEIIAALPIELRLGAQAVVATYGETYVNQVLGNPSLLNSRTYPNRNAHAEQDIQPKSINELALPPFLEEKS
jgi:hypothetical protein